MSEAIVSDKCQHLIGDLIHQFMRDNEIKPAEDEEGVTSIPEDAVEKLVELATTFICEINQYFINAGSEREVTFENTELELALINEFMNWVDVP